MRKGKRQQHSAAAAQPARFGIQHFFARHAASQQQQQQQRPINPPRTVQDKREDHARCAESERSAVVVFPAAQDPSEDCMVISPESVAECQKNVGSGLHTSKRVQLTGQDHQPIDRASCNALVQGESAEEVSPGSIVEYEKSTGGQARKRFKLSPSMVSNSQDVFWKCTPTAQRLQICSGTQPSPGTQQRLALRPCQSKAATNVHRVCAVVSPRSKISPGIAEKLENWLAIESNKENVQSTQFTASPKLLMDKTLSPVPQGKVRREVKRGKHRKVLLDLLEQVESVILDDKSGSDAISLSMEEANNILQHEIEQHTSDCQDAVAAIPEKANIHYLVLEVSESGYEKQDSHSCSLEKVIRLLDETNAAEKLAYLRDEWIYTAVKPGDTVNIIGEFELDGSCVIDHKHNLLVLHPDVLVSGSRVGSSFSCPRRAVLDERIKSSDSSLAALLGTMLHRLFQAALTFQEPSVDALKAHAKKIVIEHIDGLYAIGGDEKDILSKLVDAIPVMLDWLQDHMNPKEEVPNVDFGMATGKRCISISEVVDIEEMILSPKYGLKGMIDASIRVQNDYLPLEFKTGKATTGQAGVEHRAQVILYTLLMSDRYSEDVDKGILFYSHSRETQGIQVQHADLTGLMMRRNEHAGNLLLASSTQTLPPMLQGSRMCHGCRQLDVCAVYHKVQEGGTAETSGLGELYGSLTAHLKPNHGQFLQHWEKLIDLEAHMQTAAQSEIWRTPSSQREERNRCLSSAIITAAAEDKDRPGGYIYYFKKQNSRQRPLQLHGFSLGDYVLLSTESGHIAVAGGIVRSVDSESVGVSVSHSLRIPGTRNDSNIDSNRIFKELWRVDKDDSSSSFGIMRYNLLQLFVRDGARRSRELIVDLEIPRFDNCGAFSQDPAAMYVRSVANLNHDQRNAIGKILSARDYGLILGMPGTGKTSTIVHAVKALLARGSSVLLASYTNSAVDNILLKLKSEEVEFVRVGRPEAVHPDLVQYAIGHNVTSVEDLRTKIDQAKVVGATCLGVTHALFSKRKFDVCIIDEAGQITLPVSLGPLRCAHTFILVGDHYQLPPLIQNAEAREKGMAISLFRRLSEAHPQAVSALQSQYRMCSNIMNLCNVLIYGHRLRCGSAEVANARLNVNVSKGLPLWTQQVLDPSRSLLFLDMDGISFQEKRHASAKQNIAEASVLLNILSALSQGGVDPRSIGVISPYKAQVDYIKRRAEERKLSETEVHTIDKYQGRDKECILVSFVLSQDQRVSGSLLTDWHRINVAITRAKRKLIMIGSAKALSSVPLLKLLIDQVEKQGGLLKLPEDTLTSL